MDRLSALITIVSAIIAFLGPLLVPILIVPFIDISVIPTIHGNVTQATITIRNVGFEPAKNLKITMNPQFDILESPQLTYHTEDAKLTTTGPLNLVVDMDRLANGQMIIINVNLNSTGKQMRIFEIHANHEKGSQNYHYESQNSLFRYVDSLILELVVSIILTSLILIIRLLPSRRNPNTSETNSSPSITKKPDDSSPTLKKID